MGERESIDDNGCGVSRRGKLKKKVYIEEGKCRGGRREREECRCYAPRATFNAMLAHNDVNMLLKEKILDVYTFRVWCAAVRKYPRTVCGIFCYDDVLSS